MRKGILQFIREAISDSNKVIMQNVVGGLSFLVLLTLIYADLIFKRTITSFLFEGLLYIILGALALGTVSSFKKKDEPKEEIKGDELPEVEEEKLKIKEDK